MDYNSSNFRNKDIDKFKGRFGNGDPVNKTMSAINATESNPPLITRGRAKAARDMRKDVTPMQNEDGSQSTHVMAGGEGGSKKHKYTVNPTVFPNEGGKTWTDLRDDPMGAYKESNKRGETFGFKSEKKAEKFAMGSWKKGQAGREAMQNYRDSKKNNELYTQSVNAQKQGKNENIKATLQKKK